MGIMGDLTITYLTCNNTEVIKDFCELMDSEYLEGDTKAEGSSICGVPYQEVKELSKRYPDDLLGCRFLLEQHIGEISMEFKDGEESLVDYRPIYGLNCPSGLLESLGIAKKVEEKIADFFKQVDKPGIDENGHFTIVWSGDDVTYRFEIESDNPLKRYRVEARKASHSHVEIKLFKGKAVFEWDEMIEERLAALVFSDCTLPEDEEVEF